MSPTGRRADVLELLRAAGEPMSVLAIADRLDVHPNTARFHLDALLASGQVQRAEPAVARPGRPAQLFVATAGMDPAGPRDYRLLAEALADSVARGPDPIRQAQLAGEVVGLRLGKARRDDTEMPPVARLMKLLDDIGFAPELDEPRIDLRHCPFLEVARAHPEVVCPLHLGLMQGAMQAWQAPQTVATLTPFAQPDRCRAQLTGAGA